MVATATTAFPRRFVPKDLDFSQWPSLEPLFYSLLDRRVGSVADLEKWLLDFSELTAVVDEYAARKYIDKSCHTDDEKIEKAYLHFAEQIDPKIKPLHFQLQKKFLDSLFRRDMNQLRYKLLDRKWQADVDLFREENIPLETEVVKLNAEHDKAAGAMMVNFQGKEYTMQQMARFAEMTDRAVRREAFELSWKRRLEDREKSEQTFEALLKLRETIASNARKANYRDYTWTAYKRFDYGPEDCLRFADSIAKACVPVVRQLDEQRRRDLGVETLRAYDLAVDPKGREPLRPFKEDEISVFIDKTKSIFHRLSPKLADDFELLRQHSNLDLGSRKGKQPGGYQYSLEESREPFIFMNAAGLQRDVETLLHEGGHAFHCLAAREEPLVFLRSAPMEFCEVASMAMELLGSEHFDVFYNPVDAGRARRTLIEGVIRFLPWMAMIDSFQQWIYTHQNHTREQRTAHWLELSDRFRGGVDWSGYEEIRSARWQPQAHLFHAPFYYIEYGIAQLGALQLWMKSKEDPRRALDNYRAALALGGTKPLPELFSAAGIRFDFSEKTLVPLMAALGEELEALPR